MSTCGVVALAGGSFLTLRDALRPIPGVISVVIGYTGGWKKVVTYEEVCRDRTGHSEAVLVFFNKNQLPFARLLEVYFNSHDANGKEKQGELVGLQFRSVVYLADHDQLEVFSSVKSSMDQKTVEKFEKEPDGLSPRLILTDTATLKPSAFQVEGLPDATLIQIRDKAQADITKKVKILTKEEIATLAQKVQIEAQNLKQARETVDVSWIAKPNRNSIPQVEAAVQKEKGRSTPNLNQDIPLPPKPPAKEEAIAEN
jgi:peptide-methionine (S)-S-oxide reductase